MNMAFLVIFLEINKRILGTVSEVTASVPKSTSKNLKIPARYRINYFNGEEGKAPRLGAGDHPLLQRQKPKRCCMLCKVKTTCKCETCTVFLCRFTHGQKIKSCWDKFHKNDTIVEETKVCQ